jgi:hypothetical protein
VECLFYIDNSHLISQFCRIELDPTQNSMISESTPRSIGSPAIRFLLLCHHATSPIVPSVWGGVGVKSSTSNGRWLEHKFISRGNHHLKMPLKYLTSNVGLLTNHFSFFCSVHVVGGKKPSLVLTHFISNFHSFFHGIFNFLERIA